MKPLSTYDIEHGQYICEQFDVRVVSHRIYNPPINLPEALPAATIVSRHIGRDIVHVGWKPDEIELVHLAQGGTLWLHCWGGLNPHSLSVQEP